MRRLHLAVVSISALSGLVLLTSTPDNAEALRQAEESLELPREASIALTEQTLELPPQTQAGSAEPPLATAATLPEAPASEQTGSALVAVDEALEESERLDTAHWEQLTVKSGDSLAAIFKRIGLGPRDVHEVLSAGESAQALKRIFPGDEIHYVLDDAGKLGGLRYPVDESVTLHIAREDDGYLASLEANPLETRINHARGTIDSSLFLAGKSAGLNDGLIMELAGIFGWDVDFALDIRRGDQFSVIYEELYRDGEKVRNGAIIAAEFINRDRRFRAVRYTRPDGEADYYSEDGRSMRKAFLRSPVDFRRISSRYNPNRLHPKLGIKRPHRGVDYAAATGTPIRSAGDGKIVFRGVKGGYGNVVIVQHGSRYSTLYAHMSRFARGHRVGSRVRQGQTIGYVGATGLATGPHLHYEFRVDGVHRNPLTVKLPEAEPIPEHLRADFETQVSPLLAQLNVINGTELASTGD
ncbi:peptidoglycan DD-metalloendopeptidase family protein [Alkalilimnicola sp. S0819]|nr:peptidoglycan DD-metalloendopeptidase family protein [Alkalilimnicola sp. S0819]MPQ17157.1 peptidoglycan DD-metalloendopeptidase family protein [Alkalilimnicola sp. S0819]